MNIEPKQPTRKAPADWFTGDVYIDAIHVRKPQPSRMAGGCVHFTPGARTAWHSHAVGQTLLITEGTALLGTRDGTVIVARPGQVVYTPPGEEHWHGAAPDSFMAHIAMYEGTEDGDGARWLEHVTDQQYKAAAAATETHCTPAMSASPTASNCQPRNCSTPKSTCTAAPHPSAASCPT